MEEFMQLNWSKKYPRPLTTRRDVYSCGFSDDESDVYVCHMNEIDPEFYGKCQEDSKLPDDKEKNDDSCQGSSTNNSPPRKTGLRLFRKFPTKSKMDHQIHLACLRFLKKLEDQEDCTESQLVDDEDQKAYRLCEATRKQEKTEFHEFVKNHFQTHLRHRILKIDVNMESILIDRWKRSVEDVKKRHHQNYQLQTALPLDMTGTDVHLSYHEEINRSGIAPRISDLSNKEEIILEQNPKELESYLQDNPTVNEKSDKLVKELVQRNEIDFIAPLEAIEILLNGADTAWNIPFRMEESESRKMGFIEAPLPLSADTKHRNLEILKCCYEMRVLQRQNENEILDSGNSHEDLMGDPENAPDSDSDEEQQLFIDDFDEELPKEPENNSPEKGETLESEKMPTDKSFNLENGHRDQRRAQSIVYRGCTLSSGSEKCKILVKSPEDGSVLGDKESESVNFSIKIEYQVEFGAEEMTLEELIHEWCLQIFNPGSRTLRIRIDSQSLKVLSVKEVPLKKVERDLSRLHGVSPQDLLQKLWGVLSVMKNFPGHNYLMHHEVSHGKKLMIYVSRDSGEPDRNFLQLSRIFENVEFKRKPLLEQDDWLPIDDQEVTFLHEQDQVMPCAFPCWGKEKNNSHIWNEKKNLLQKYEARQKAKNENRMLQEKRIKSEKNRAKSLRKQMKKAQKKLKKSQEGTEKFAKMLTESGGATVPDWFFDEDGRVRIHRDP